MKNTFSVSVATVFFVALFSFFSNNLFSQTVHNGRVNPLRVKGTGPKSVDELATRLAKKDSTLFIGGITHTQWLDKVAEGLNYGGAARFGFDSIDRSEALWLVENSVVIATPSSLGQYDYLSSGSVAKKLHWIKNPAQPDSLLVYMSEGGDFLILAKWDCLNPTCDLRKAKEPSKKPAKVEEKKEPRKSDPLPGYRLQRWVGYYRPDGSISATAPVSEVFYVTAEDFGNYEVLPNAPRGYRAQGAYQIFYYVAR